MSIMTIRSLIVLHPFNLFRIPKKTYKVCILGSAGGIGQPTALLLKLNPLVSKISMYDINAPMNIGAAIDISHLQTPCAVDCFNGPEQLPNALEGSHVVTIIAGSFRKPDQTRDDLFAVNAKLVYDFSCAIANHCPCAFICIVTNPVNVLTPLVSEVMGKHNVYDPAKIFGVTTLDVVRASTFAAEVNNSDPRCQYVPVIGGHSVDTTIPLFSQSKPPLQLDEKCEEILLNRVRDAGGEIVNAKQGNGSSTLAMSYAQVRFIDALLRGLTGQPNVVECSFVRSNCTGSPYFATPLLLGPHGVQCDFGIPTNITPFEKKHLESAVKILFKSTRIAQEFVATMYDKNQKLM